MAATGAFVVINSILINGLGPSGRDAATSSTKGEWSALCGRRAGEAECRDGHASTLIVCSGCGDGTWERSSRPTRGAIGSAEDVVEGLGGEGATSVSAGRLVGRGSVAVGRHGDRWTGGILGVASLICDRDLWCERCLLGARDCVNDPPLLSSALGKLNGVDARCCCSLFTVRGDMLVLRGRPFVDCFVFDVYLERTALLSSDISQISQLNLAIGMGGGLCFEGWEEWEW